MTLSRMSCCSSRQTHFAHGKVVLFRVRLARSLRQSGRDKGMRLLVGIATRDVDLAQVLQLRRHQSGLGLQFVARDLRRIDAVLLQAALRKLQRIHAEGIAILLDQIDLIAVDGKHDGTVVLLYYAVDAARAVVALDLILAHGHPGIAIHHARTQLPNRHGSMLRETVSHASANFRCDMRAVWHHGRNGNRR